MTKLSSQLMSATYQDLARNVASNNENNSTCYWAIDKVTEKHESTFPYFLYFLIAFGVTRAFKIIVDMKQLRCYKVQKPDDYIAELFTEKEFQDS